jgi:hypothetical protein
MARILYIVFGVLALTVFANAQYRGYGLFDDTASGSSVRGSGGRATFHK